MKNPVPDLRLLLLLLVTTATYLPTTQASSRNTEIIKFENGVYNDIVIGLDPHTIQPQDCAEIVENLKSTLTTLSSTLHTNKRSRIGTVSILIPQTWPDQSHNCGPPPVSKSAPPNRCYKTSHIQVTTTHPLATTLPYTKQYKPCGQESDSIIIPTGFLNTQLFSEATKANLLLHEWSKFRYGVFDEIGYYNDDVEHEYDNPLPPCYSSTNPNDIHFTTCTTSPLPTISSNKSACTRNLVTNQKDTLHKFLQSTNSSIMSTPYLPTVSSYCTPSTHNKLAPTKQNMWCNRRSVSEVIDSHPDFNSTTQQLPNDSSSPPPPPTFNIIKHAREYKTAYAFIIDNSEGMQTEYKILHVKHAIAEFLGLLDYGVEVHVTIFKESTVVDSLQIQINNDQDKSNVLAAIPDVTIPTTRAITPNQKQPHQLLPVLTTVLGNLTQSSIFNWNVLFFGDTNAHESNDTPQAIQLWSTTHHSISVFTFESESVATPNTWLSWYTIPNTLNVIVLPYCRDTRGSSGPCSIQTSVFILNHLVHLVSRQEVSPRFINKAKLVVIRNSLNKQEEFVIDGDMDTHTYVKNFYVYLLSPNPGVASTDRIILTSPSGNICVATVLYGYSGVVTFDSCDYEPGTWTLRLTEPYVPGPPSIHMDVFIEYEPDSINRLIITPSFTESDLIHGIDLNTNNTGATPVYVHVTTATGNPVLNATVMVHVFYPFIISSGQGYVSATEINLTDSGGTQSYGMDLYENDGVYSSVLQGYNQDVPSYHLLSVKVATSAETVVLESIKEPSPAYLDTRMGSKCCGLSIKPGSVRKLLTPPGVTVKFQLLHMGFKTNGPWRSRVFPPDRVGGVEVVGSDSEVVTLSFRSVMPDPFDRSVGVESIQGCCVVDGNGSSDVPDESNCWYSNVECGGDIPSDPGELVSCNVLKSKLASSFVAPGYSDIPYVSLTCGLRLFNTNHEPGGISSGVFSVDLYDYYSEGGGGGSGSGHEVECKKWSDGCLPMWVFWVLVGGVCFLVFLLCVVGVWGLVVCCRRRRRGGDKVAASSGHKDSQVTITTTSQSGSPGNSRGVEINRDDTVQYTSVTCQQQQQPSRQSSPLPLPRKPKSPKVKIVKELYINHAYIQDERSGDLKIITDDGKILRKPDVGSHGYNEHNMEVYKPEYKGLDGSPPPPPRKIVPRTRNTRPKIVHQNPLLRSDDSGGGGGSVALVTTGGLQATQDPVHYMVPQNAKKLGGNNNMIQEPPPPIARFPSTSSSSESSRYGSVQQQQNPVSSAGRPVIMTPPKFKHPPAYPVGSSYARSSSPPSYPPPVPPPRGGNNGVGVLRLEAVPLPKRLNKSYYGDDNYDEDSDEWDDGDVVVSYA